MCVLGYGHVIVFRRWGTSVIKYRLWSSFVNGLGHLYPGVVLSEGSLLRQYTLRLGEDPSEVNDMTLNPMISSRKTASVTMRV